MWKDIEEINWAERCKDPRGYEQAKRYIMENFTQARCKKLREFVEQQYAGLEIAINIYESEHDTHCGDYGGDDSFNDMIHHAIGMGEKYYNAVVANPKLLDAQHSVESFSYCLPQAEDFEAIQNGYFEEHAVNCIWELARILKQNEPTPEDTKIILGLISRFSKMVQGEFDAACEGFNDKAYHIAYQFEANDMHARFANILSDCKKYKL